MSSETKYQMKYELDPIGFQQELSTMQGLHSSQLSVLQQNEIAIQYRLNLPLNYQKIFSYLPFYMMVVDASLRVEEFSNKFNHITTLMGNVKCRSKLIDRQNVLRRLHNINLPHLILKLKYISHLNDHRRYPVPGLSLFLLQRKVIPSLISESVRDTMLGVRNKSREPRTYLTWL